ncbi:ankyrin repeat domain-containing protein [Flavobacterium foetidum]|uniref:ankyrin repeat domain-containing protein n=1 Tax=Flavobacterium foetidum TaxID=2026681 RepID=UPI0010753D4A|nr:ankyrin repeat domain-containing protein [Flavobacterium foetidum]KAF2508273.1 ankyrin repeat domain-containing protein [Flavobacterium foetidum]
MKKTVVILGVLLLLGGASIASNLDLKANNQVEFSNYQKSALHLAISKGDIDAVRKFIMYESNIDKMVNKMVNNMTPLMLAARFNHCDIMQILLANGADLSVQNSHGLTALHYAEFAKSNEAIEILKQKKENNRKKRD